MNRHPEGAAARPTLDELARLHGTDKATDHRFAPIYASFLEARRDDPLTVLEIGVLEGASLRTWRDYFPNGRIFGVDVDEDVRGRVGDLPVFIGDQSDLAFLASVIERTGPLDLIVDDGGHLYEQQIGSLLYLWPSLSPGGIYIVEDIHTSYLERWGMAYRRRPSTVETLKDVVDDVHVRWHEQTSMLDDVASIHFFPETCVIVKSEPRRGT